MPLSLPRMDPPIGEDTPVAPPDLEGEAGAAIRPSLTSGYSKQFQKSLPPRFLRQQVLDWCCLELFYTQCRIQSSSWEKSRYKIKLISISGLWNPELLMLSMLF